MHINTTRPSQVLKVFGAIALLLCGAPSHAQGATGGGAAVTPPPPHDVKASHTKYEFRIPMRDGKRLFTAVYVPKSALTDGKRYPFLMTRTPYGCGPYGVDRYSARLAPSEDFLKAGYILVCQDVRGRFMSEGEFLEMRPHVSVKRSQQDVDDSSDMHDSVQWLLDHVEGHNGRVGIWGNSYPGFYTAASIIDSHPAIKAASPQAPIADYYHGDDGYHGGALMLAHNYSFFSWFWPQANPVTEFSDRKPFKYDSGDAYEYFLKLGNLKNIAATLAPGGNRYFNELVEHNQYDTHWKPRSLTPHLKNIKAAVLTVGGWFDAEDLPGPLAIYRSIEQKNPGISNQLVMGPWRHGGWLRTPGKGLGQIDFAQGNTEFFQKQILLPFFEQHLKDAPAAKLAEAMIFETGTNVWRRFESWPPAKAEPRTLYLQSGGRLAWQQPTADEAGADSYLSDPAKPVPFTHYPALGMPGEYMVGDQRFAARRPDVLVYQTEPLEQDVTLTGPMLAKLFVSTTGTDADFIVKLIDVYPHDVEEPPARSNTGAPADEVAPKPTLNGFQQLVRAQPLRARFRNGFEQGRPMVPGQVEALSIELPDVQHAFRRGHRIMVQVQSSWFPLLDRNPQTFVRIQDARPEDFQAATQRVYRGGVQASCIEVKVMR